MNHRRDVSKNEVSQGVIADAFNSNTPDADGRIPVGTSLMYIMSARPARAT